MNKQSKICLITPGQPSTNPRLVKESDALCEAGYDVQVLCARWAQWADDLDVELLKSRSWKCTYVDTRHGSWRYKQIRLRHAIARRLQRNFGSSSLWNSSALSRVGPELENAAKSYRADLYIAHNLSALIPAIVAAKKWGAKVGFDAEDFHSGMGEEAAMQALIERIERKYLPQCDYLTAGSPEIAQAYADKYPIPLPVSILNVFPLQERPEQFRPQSSDGALKLYWFSQTIGEKRGLEDVVRAMGKLANCDIELHLRGQWQNGYQETLSALAQSVGVPRAKIIAHAPASADDMARLASEYDVGLALEPFTRPNNQLCLSNKIFTYLLAGNTVIATATKAQKSIVQVLGDAACNYESDDAEHLASLLKLWHDDRQTLQKARCKAWQMGETRYNWDIEKQRFLEVVDAALRS